MSIFSNSKSFTDLDELIHSGIKEINLDNDFKLNTGIFSKDKYGINGGIKLDIDNLIIDGHGHGIVQTAHLHQSGTLPVQCIDVVGLIFKNLIKQPYGFLVFVFLKALCCPGE